MSDSGDSSTSRKLWKLARNRKQTVSETALRYHCQKPAQRRPLSSIQYLQSMTGMNDCNADANSQDVFYNERLIDDTPLNKSHSPPLGRTQTGAEICYEESIFPLPWPLRSEQSNLRSIIGVQEISASIRLGSMYSSAGYGWKDQTGKFTYHILDNWNECSHCPEKDKHRTLSQVLLSVKPLEEIVAFGYEAHKAYLSIATRQRKKFVYKTDFNGIFGQNLTDSVSDGICTMKLDVHRLCIAVIRHFRQAVLNDIRKKKVPLMAPPVGKLIWTIVVDNDAVKKNITKVLPDIPMTNCRVVLLRDSTACSIAEEIINTKVTSAGASLRRYMSSPSLVRPTLPSPNSFFILLNIGAKSTEATFFTLNRDVLCPSTSKQCEIGGQAVTDGFYKFLALMFGLKMLQTYKKENYEGHTDLLCAIEKAKRSAEKNQSLCLHLPFSFSQHFKKKAGRSSCLADHANRMECRFNSVSNSVILETGKVSAIFLAVVNRITALLEEVLVEEEIPTNALVYLTGGFSRNSLFQDLIEEALPLRKFVPIENPAGLPLIGSIQRALKSRRVESANVLTTLQSSFTIGVTAAAHCDWDALQTGSLVEKGLLLYNAFVPFVKKDEYLTGKDHSSKHSFFAASPIQESILVRLFFTENDETDTVFQDTMQCVSQLQLHIPLEKRGVSTGNLFIFQVVVRFVQEPEGITVTVKDSNGLVYGCCRVLRNVTY